MEKTVDTKKGTLRVSEGVIITIVKNTASEIDGIQRIAQKPLRIKSLLHSSTESCDISVNMVEGVCRISLNVVAKSGYNIVSVCEQIQERVKAAVQSMTGVTVSQVNVTVSDVDFSDQVPVS